MEDNRKRAVIADDGEEDIDVPAAAPEDSEVAQNEQPEDTQEQQTGESFVEEGEEGEEGEMDDLFGDDEDENEIDSRAADENGVVHDSDDANEDDDEHDPFLVRVDKETKEVRVGEEDIIRHPPKFDNKSGEIFVAKVPKFLLVEPTRFDGTDHLKQLEQLAKAGVSKDDMELKKLQDENTIRWRFTKQSDESLTAESNAQIIEWEDGSLSMKLGDEIFDVMQSSVTDTYLSTTDDDIVGDDDTKPVLLVADGKLTKAMKFVPTSTNSRFHQKLTTAIRSRQKAKAAAQTVFVEVDPALEAKRLEKEQDDRLREKRRQQLKMERDQERLGSAGPGATKDRYSAREREHYSRVQDEYENDDGFIDDEEEEDDDDVMEDVDEDEDDAVDDDEDDLAAERLKRVKAEGASKYQESDNEEVQTRKKRRVIDDDDEDDE